MEEFKKKFASQKFVDEYAKYKAMIKYIERELEVVKVPNGIIHPYCLYDPENEWTKPAWGGVTDENLKYIEISGLDSRLVQVHPEVIKRIYGYNPDYNYENIKYYDETVIYLGRMEDNWGHFLHETIPRLWYLIDHPECNYKIAYISIASDIFLDCLYLMGISPDRLIRINEPTKFREVIVPELCCRVNDLNHKKYKSIIDKMSESVPEGPYKKVYFSRDLMAKKGMNIGEKEIENVFLQDGFIKVCPEALSIREKISIVKGAEIIAMAQGSGQYNLLFAKEGTKAISFNTSGGIAAFTLAEFFIDLDLYFVDAYNNPMPVHNGVGPTMLTLTPYLEEFFNHFNMEYDREVFAERIPANTIEFYKYWIMGYSNPAYVKLLHEFYPNIDIERVLKQLIGIFENLAIAGKS